MAPRPETVLVKSIHVEDGRLPLVQSHVDRLAQSIKEVGLLEPIIICRRVKATPSVVLVAGRHRLEAHKKLRLKEIAAIVENEDSPAVERWRVLAEIDENLVRRDLTSAQRARETARRKTAYEEIYPETKHGGARRGSSPKVSDLKSFASETAAKGGRSRQSVELDVARARKLGPDLDRIAGTSLDKGAELDALAAMPPEVRAPIIQRAASGEEVSAIRTAFAQEPKPGYADLCRSWKVFRTAWLKASQKAKASFVEENGEDIDAIFGASSADKAIANAG